MAYTFLERKPRDIQFFYEGENLQVPEVFTMLYSYLDDSIEKNFDANFRKAKHQHREKPPAPYVTNPDIGIDALVTFDDTSVLQCQVLPRTNFDYKHVMKRPNMAYLRSKNTIAIIREAREYPIEMIDSIYNRKYSNKYDRDATHSLYERKVNKGKLEPTKRTGRISIPEPQLTLSLEELYKNNTINRITPPFSAIDSDSSHLWYLRDFHPLAFDVSFDTELFGELFATLHALGLSEQIDRQAIHYCHIDHSIGTYDPDFITFSPSRKATVLSDWNDIKKTFVDDKFPLPNDPEIYFKEMKKIMNSQMEQLTAQGITPEGFLQKLNPKITLPSYIPKVEQKY